jgi:hypothetical protein
MIIYPPDAAPASTPGAPEQRPKTPLARGLLSRWSFWFTVGSAVIYVVGYLKCLVYLRSLGVLAPPTAIFGFPDLFVSGLSFMLAALFVPSSSFVAGIAVYRMHLRGHGSFPLGFSVGALLLLVALLLIGFLLSPVGLGLPFQPTLPFPMSTLSPLVNVFAIFALAFAGASFARRRSIRWASVAAVIAFVWVVALLAAESWIPLRQLHMGDAPQLNRQDPGTLGTIVINVQTPESRPACDTTTTDRLWEVDGLLLSRLAGNVYFVPLVKRALADGFDLSGTRLLEVPECRVVYFSAQSPPRRPRLHWSQLWPSLWHPFEPDSLW